MKQSCLALALAILTFQSTLDASAQQSLPRSPRIEITSETPRTEVRQSSLMKVLDANRDGKLSKQEIDNAAVSLRALDKNHDGTIDAAELQPMGTPIRPRRQEETTADDKPELSGFTKLIMEFDKNRDGKITKDELPENMRPIFQNADANHDGAITVEEAERLGNPSKRAPRATR